MNREPGLYRARAKDCAWADRKAPAGVTSVFSPQLRPRPRRVQVDGSSVEVDCRTRRETVRRSESQDLPGARVSRRRPAFIAIGRAPSVAPGSQAISVRHILRFRNDCALVMLCQLTCRPCSGHASTREESDTCYVVRIHKLRAHGPEFRASSQWRRTFSRYRYLDRLGPNRSGTRVVGPNRDREPPTPIASVHNLDPALPPPAR